MKKLLVTVIGAAVAFGAFADAEPGAREIGPGVRFEELTETTNTVAQLKTLTGNYWSEPAGATNVYTRELIDAMDASYGQGGHPPAWESTSSSTKALGVKTTFGSPLSFSVNTNGTAVDIADGLYFDSQVKFTVCEDPVTTEYEGAKIVMWLQESTNSVGDVNGTNLLVRAGYLSKGQKVAAAQTVYTTTTAIAGDFADKWHRVTIKSLADITDGGNVPGFAIYIDGNNPVQTYGQAKWDSTFSSSYALNEIARNIGEAKLFPSLVQANDEVAGYQKISSVAFDGTGSINELQFYGDDIAPDFAGNDQYLDTKFDVTIGGTTTPYKKIADAVAAVNAAESDCTISLASGFTFDGPLAFNNANDVWLVLDLNGHGITNANAESAFAITLAASTKLEVTDTSMAKTGIIVSDDEDYGVVTINDDGARFALTAGTIYGLINVEAEEDQNEFYSLTGGTVKYDSLDIDGTGYAYAEIDGRYDDTVYDIVPAFTVTFDPANGGEAAEQIVATNALAVVPADPEWTGHTFDGWLPDPSSTVIVSNTTFTAQWSDVSVTVTFNKNAEAATGTMSDQSFTYGVEQNLTANAFEYAGHTFAGWSNDPNGDIIYTDGAPATLTANCTLYAKWNVNTYTVKFVYGINKEYTNTVSGVTYGTELTLPANPDPAYAVAGYNITWPTFVAVTADATYEASYSGISYTINTYVIGTVGVNATTNFVYAGVAGVPAAPVFDSTKKEWDGKWYTDDTHTVEFSFSLADATQSAYVVLTDKSSPVKPVAPGEDITPPTGKTAAEYANEINAAIDGGTGESYIEVPAEASGTKATYLGILKAQVNEKGKIDIVFNEEATGYAAVTNAIETVAIPAVGDVLPTVAAAAAESSTNVSITGGLMPGLYYSISYCTDLANFGTQYENEGTRVKANASGAATLQTPAKASAATAGFYRVNVNVSDKK